MTTAQTFQNYYPLLYSIAYKILQSKEDAEDVVQETFYKWLQKKHEDISNVKAYLIKAVKNTCFNYLKTLKKRNEKTFSEYSTQINEYHTLIEDAYLDFEQELTVRFSKIMKMLTPKEQVVFVLKDSFDFSYDDIIEIVDTKIENARKIFQRANERMKNQQNRFELNQKLCKKHLDAYVNAHLNGDVCDYINILKKDLSLWIDKKTTNL